MIWLKKISFKLTNSSIIVLGLSAIIIFMLLKTYLNITDYTSLTLEMPTKRQILIIAKPIGLELESNIIIYDKIFIFKKKLFESDVVCYDRVPFQTNKGNNYIYQLNQDITVGEFYIEYVNDRYFRVTTNANDMLSAPIEVDLKAY